MPKEMIDRHHLVPKKRKKMNDWKQSTNPLLRSVTVRMSRTKHDAWHGFFGLRTIDEAIAFLIRIRSLAVRKGARHSRKRKKAAVPINDTYFVRA